MKKLLQLSNSSRPAAIDEEDLVRCKLYNWGVVRPLTGIHIRATVNGSKVNLSNFIMNDFRSIIDHIDRNPFNNQRSNLRACTQSQNLANSTKRKETTSKYKGVTWDKDRNLWKAQIQLEYKHLFLGRYPSEEEAARAYDTKAKKLFKEFAVLNFPGGDS
jgi:hypothetical protein